MDFCRMGWNTLMSFNVKPRFSFFSLILVTVECSSLVRFSKCTALQVEEYKNVVKLLVQIKHSAASFVSKKKAHFTKGFFQAFLLQLFPTSRISLFAKQNLLGDMIVCPVQFFLIDRNGHG